MTRRGIALALSVAALAACFTSGNAPADGGPDGAEAGPQTAAGVFAASCALSGCHVGPDAPFKLDLSPSAYYASLVDVPANEAAGVMRVKPGDSTDTQSYLLCKVDPECAVIGARMPATGGLSANDIAVLRAWVASLPPDDAGPPASALDTTPPVFAGASAATAGPSSITLSWAPASDDVTPTSEIVYGIYETTSPGLEDFYSPPTAITPPGATSFAMGPLPPNSTYYFVVYAFDHAHNDDGNDVEVTATTPATVDSSAPTFAGATSAQTVSTGSVSVSWAPASDDWSSASQISYLVYASPTSGGPWVTPDLVTVAGATSGVVHDLGGDTLYHFVVRAKDQAGNVDANQIEVTAQTGSVSFTKDVWPLFGQACTSSGCHASPNIAENIDLSSASTAHATLVGVPSSQCPSFSLVTTSQPKTSYLLQKLRGWGSCFTGWPMPEQQTPFTAAQIDLVAAWIGKGAPLD